MKLVTIKNATVIPQYKKNPNDPDEVMRVFPSNSSDRKIVRFRITTPQNDSNVKDGKLYENCVILAEDENTMKTIRDIVKNNAVLTIEGHEESYRLKNGNYIRSIRVKDITTLSSGSDPVDDIPIEEG